MHKQRIFADPRRGDGSDANGDLGDCWRTCIANVLGIMPEDVPNFVGYLSWIDEARLWLADYGLAYGRALDYGAWPSAREFLESRDQQSADSLYIVTGPSTRGPWRHCVLMDRDLVMVHDPHPSDAGIVGDDIRLLEVEAVVDAWLYPRPIRRALEQSA